MKKTFALFVGVFALLILVSGCNKGVADEENPGENIREVWITNDTDLYFKSIDMIFDDDTANVLLTGPVTTNDTKKFSIPEGVSSVTVTLNSRDAYSVKEELELTFDDDNILKYKIETDKNVITLKLHDKEENL